MEIIRHDACHERTKKVKINLQEKMNRKKNEWNKMIIKPLEIASRCLGSC